MTLCPAQACPDQGCGVQGRDGGARPDGRKGPENIVRRSAGGTLSAAGDWVSGTSPGGGQGAPGGRADAAGALRRAGVQLGSHRCWASGRG